MPNGQNRQNPQKRRARAAPATGLLVVALGTGTGAAVALSARDVYAGPGDAQAQSGLAAAKRGRCEEAIPLLEEAEGQRHRPHTALVLAECYATFGELLQASALYGAIAEEPADRSHTAADREAIALAPKRVRELEDRIPTIGFSIPAGYEGVVVTIEGEPVESLKEPRKVDPHKDIAVVVRAKGMKERKETINLEERERRVISLDPLPSSGASAKNDPARGPRTWIGGGYRGFVIPKFVMNIVGDGGRTVVAPGGVVSVTRPSGDLDLVFSLGYALFLMPPTPFKPSGTPDTEYEIIQSDLNALTASFELLWNVPLDQQKRFRFRVGAGFGLGYTFLGELYRRQSYPANFTPGDPYTYLPCYGPNNPPGSFRYCNSLDKDANHYGAYAEPSWFSGGVRPLVYPWVALPILGLSFRPTPRIAIDLDIAPTLSGVLTELGVRFGL